MANDLPYANQVSLVGQIGAVKPKDGAWPKFTFELHVGQEYGSKEEPEAVLTCLAGAGDDHGYLLSSGKASGRWASITGKIRSGGRIQIRTLTIFELQTFHPFIGEVLPLNTEGGPCKECDDPECIRIRRIAAKDCVLCGRPIGYETTYACVSYGVLCHVLCLFEEVTKPRDAATAAPPA